MRIIDKRHPTRAAALALAMSLAACGGTEQDCNATGTCPNANPVASITSPGASAMFDQFVSISFAGSASDAEDGALSGASLVWTSNVDGAIGTGTSFSRSDLSTGAHIVTLTATDSDGGSGTATVAFTVVEVANSAPSVTITAPSDGGSAIAGESVTFSGSANDAEDGAITGAALVWTSDLDGTIGTGNTFQRDDLSGGMHEIVLTATDGDGAFGADTIAFSIGGAPTIVVTAPTNQGGGAPHTVDVGTSVTFSATATDVEDGALSGASIEWESNVDGPIGTGTSFSLSSLSAGLHTVTITATDSDTNESRETALVIVRPANAPGYQIAIRLSEGVELTAAQRTAVDDAVVKLQSMIVGDVADLPTTSLAGGSCSGAAIPPMNEPFDDVVIYLEFVPIDGAGNVLGSAGPCFIRSGTAFSLVGGMRFDTDDLDFLESLGLLDDIVLHEMMHVLGFGIFWDSPVDYLEQPSNPADPNHTPGMTDTHFTGPEALARFDSLGGASYTGGMIVPVENDTATFSTGSLDGHWRESVFDNEIMTSAANIGSNPMSELTIGQFDDLGYTVDFGAAEVYTPVFSIVIDPGNAMRVLANAIDLRGDVSRGPIFEVDPGGTVRRIR